MKILLDGAGNTRDLGGMQTAFGTIKQNRLVRSGELSRLTTTDVEKLLALPLKRVVDLRTPAERENSPDVKMDGVCYDSVQIIRATTFGITYEKSSGQEIAMMLKAGYERMKNRGENYGEHMSILYRNFVNDSFSQTGYCRFLKLLANCPVEGATLWHCTIGKDRVGTCTALLLHCLGATQEQIFADYLYTNEQTKANRQAIFDKISAYVPEEGLKNVEKMLTADKAYLQSFFDEIQSKFRSTDGFLAAIGVTEEDISALRKNYLQ